MIGIVIGVVFFATVCGGNRGNRSPPRSTPAPPRPNARPTNTATATPPPQTQPNTVSASVASQQQDVELADVLPSYDAAVVDSNGSATNLTIPPFNPDIYNASEIEDPNLPPPPAYDEVINKSDDYQIPVSK